MAEKKTNMKDGAPQNAPKLTYEQLEVCISDYRAGKKIFQENQMLKKFFMSIV